MRPAALPGIILAAFGTTTESGKTALGAFTCRVRRACPDHAVRWAFTARHPGGYPDIDGGRGLSVRQALDFLGESGHAAIALQPLHVSAGHEHESLCREVAAWREKHSGIAVAVGQPLMTDEPSILAVLAAMREAADTLHRQRPGETPVWVGHGSEPPHDRTYQRLAALAGKEDPPVHVGCLIGGRDAATTSAALLREERAKVCLMPFFAVAGRHVRHDLGGNGPQSWKTVFEKAGIACRVFPQGLAEQAPFAALWLARLKTALALCAPK